MPRPLRNFHSGGIYHLISRFVAHEWFIKTDEERRQYLRLFGLAIARSDWRCFSYAVMSSHIHLGVLAGAMPLARWLGPAHSTFAEWMNEKHERIGSVFVRGPNAVAYKREGAPHLIAYIHRNPIRAGVVYRPEETDWTSHRSYIWSEQKPDWLDVTLGLELAALSVSDLDSWVRGTHVSREDLEEMRVVPRRVIPVTRKPPATWSHVEGSSEDASSRAR